MDAVTRHRVTVEPATGSPTEIAYYTGGTGPPVVLIHGIGLDASGVSWRETIEHLTENFSVYALDLPGHGNSATPQESPTTAYFQEILDAFLRSRGIPTAALVGISMGGAIALAQTLETEAPRGLTLVDSYGLGSDTYWRAPARALLQSVGGTGLWDSVTRSKPVVRQIVGSLTAGSGTDQSLVEDVHAAVSAPDALRTMRRWQRNEFGTFGFQTDSNDSLNGLDVPTLVVHGASDPIVPVSWSRRANEAIPDSQLRVFEHSGHWVPREQPAEFAKRTATFLERIESTSQAKRATME